MDNENTNTDKKDCFVITRYVCMYFVFHYLLTYIIVFIITYFTYFSSPNLTTYLYFFTNQVVFFKACDRLASNKYNFHWIITVYLLGIQTNFFAYKVFGDLPLLEAMYLAFEH